MGMNDEQQSEPSQALVEAVREFAPELDPAEVADFMAEHPLPDGERGTHVEWAVRILRERGDGEAGDRPSVARVADEMRRRDRP